MALRVHSQLPIQPMELFPLVLPPLCSEPSSVHGGKGHRSSQAAQSHSNEHHFSLPILQVLGEEREDGLGGREQAVFKQEREHHVAASEG